MISPSASNIADFLAQNLAQRRVSVIPKNDSVLDVLNKSTMPSTSTVDPLTGQTQRDIPLFNAMNTANRQNRSDPLSEYSEHNIAQDEIVKQISDAVRADLVIARTVVIPAVNELVQHVEDTLAKTSFSELANIDLRIWHPAEPLKTGSMDRMLEPYNDVPYGNPALGVTAPEQTYEQILEYIKTGNGDVDKDVAKWIATKDVDWVCRRFNQVFGIYQVAPNEEVPTFNGLMRSNNLDVIDTALLTFLVANRIYDDPIEGANISHAGWLERMAALRNQAGKRLASEIDRLNGFTENKVLILESGLDRRIVVYEPVYKDWIQSGGSNDVIFGFIISNGIDTTVDAINAKAETYRIAWQAQVARFRMSEDTLRYNTVRDALRAGFLEQLHAQDEEGRNSNPATSRTLLLAFNNALAAMTRTDLDDIYVSALKLLCASRFANTNAYQFLMLLNRVSKVNPGIDDREASTIASQMYVTQWLLEQCDVIVTV